MSQPPFKNRFERIYLCPVALFCCNTGLVDAVNEARAPAASLPEGRDSELDRAITRTGARLGTVVYMAPEQLRGHDTDARSDQFAFCVALYEAVAGVRPFADGDGSVASQLEIIERGDIQPPAGKARMPAWLGAVLRRGLSIDPTERFPDMAALVRAIERGRRKRWPWIAAGVGVMALALLVGSLLRMMQPATLDCGEAASREYESFRKRNEELRRHLDAAGVLAGALEQFSESLDDRARRWRDAHEILCKERADSRGPKESSLVRQRTACLSREDRFFEGLANELTARERSSDQLALAIEAVTQYFEQRVDCIELDQVCKPPEEGVQGQVAQARSALDEAALRELFGDYERAEQQTRQVLEEAGTLDYPPLRAEVQYQLGHVLDSRGDDVEAHRMMLEAADLAAEHCHLDVEADAWIYASKLMAVREPDGVPLARTYVHTARNALLRHDELHQEHLDPTGDLPAYRVLLAKGGAEPRYPRLAEYLEARGLLAKHEARYDDAIAWHEHALAVRERLQLANRSWLLSKSYNNLGNALADAGRLDVAWQHLQKAIALRAASLGATHPMVAEMHYNIGRTAMLRGDHEHSRQELMRALEIRSELHGPDSPELLPTLMALGENERQAAQHERAEEIVARIATMHRRLRERSDPAIRDGKRVHEHTLLAAVHQEHGRLAEALAEVERAIEILEAHDACAARGVSGGDYVWALHDASELAIELRRWPEARQWLQQARLMYTRCSPEDAELTQSIEKNLARVPRAADRSP